MSEELSKAQLAQSSPKPCSFFDLRALADCEKVASDSDSGKRTKPVAMYQHHPPAPIDTSISTKMMSEELSKTQLAKTLTKPRSFFDLRATADSFVPSNSDSGKRANSGAMYQQHPPAPIDTSISTKTMSEELSKAQLAQRTKTKPCSFFDLRKGEKVPSDNGERTNPFAMYQQHPPAPIDTSLDTCDDCIPRPQQVARRSASIFFFGSPVSTGVSVAPMYQQHRPSAINTDTQHLSIDTSCTKSGMVLFRSPTSHEQLEEEFDQNVTLLRVKAQSHHNIGDMIVGQPQVEQTPLASDEVVDMTSELTTRPTLIVPKVPHSGKYLFSSVTFRRAGGIMKWSRGNPYASKKGPRGTSSASGPCVGRAPTARA
jgi:hypothetical protein